MYAVELLKYDCFVCTAQQKINRGCEQDSPDQYELVVSGEVHKRCPRRPILEDPRFYQEVFWLYRQKEKGYLVDSGGLDDQPAFLMEAFRVMDGTLSKIEAHRQEKKDKKERRATLSGVKPTTGRKRKR